MNWDYSRHYARFHPETPEHDASLRALLLRWLGPHLPPNRNARILDVGCGRGYALSALKHLGYEHLSGIDIDAGQVRFAQKLGHHVVQVENSTDYLNTHCAEYDLVLLMDVLEHLPTESQCTLLNAIRESLREAGSLLCTVPNAASPLASYWRHVDFTHRCSFTRESLHFVLDQSGFDVERLEPIEFFARPRWFFWLPSRRAAQWWLLRLHRIRWRLACLAELGFRQGASMPLSLNLLARARKR